MLMMRVSYGTSNPTANFTNPCMQNRIRAIVSTVDKDASSAEHEVAQPQVEGRERDRHHRDQQTFASELPERNGIVCAAGDSEHHDVCTGANCGQVAAEVSAQRERPPQHIRVC